jgi:hypothetical protein
MLKFHASLFSIVCRRDDADLSARMWRHADLYKCADVSEDAVPSIRRDKRP